MADRPFVCDVCGEDMCAGILYRVSAEGEPGVYRHRACGADPPEETRKIAEAFGGTEEALDA